MPDFPGSRARQLLKAQWPTLEAAIDEGFDQAKDDAIDKMMLVVNDKTERIGPDHQVRENSLRRVSIRTYTAHLRTTLEIEHRFPLTAGRLVVLPTEEITQWASCVRLHERDMILRRVVRQAHPAGPYTLPAVQEGQPEGYSKKRLLTFTGNNLVANQLEAAGWIGDIKPVDARPRAHVAALLFRMGGGPIVYRANDLTLGWYEHHQGGAILTLTERLRLDRTNTACQFTN